jgi:hypothetical protein
VSCGQILQPTGRSSGAGWRPGSSTRSRWLSRQRRAHTAAVVEIRHADEVGVVGSLGGEAADHLEVVRGVQLLQDREIQRPWWVFGGFEDAEDLLASSKPGPLPARRAAMSAPRSANEGRKSMCAIARHSCASIHSRFSSGRACWLPSAQEAVHVTGEAGVPDGKRLACLIE